MTAGCGSRRRVGIDGVASQDLSRTSAARGRAARLDQVTLSEPVTTGADPFSLARSDGSSFDLSASSADQTSCTLDPDGSLPLGESCALPRFPPGDRR